MTAPDPLDEWYRAAVAETMRPCPELPRVQQRERSPRVRSPRHPCPACGTEYVKAYLPQHISRAHSQPVDSPGENVDRVAS